MARALLAGLLVTAGELWLLHVQPTGIDAISLGMAALSLGCCVRTARLTATAVGETRWRWRAATIGWLLWTLHWCANATTLLPADAALAFASVVILLERVAFVVAIVPMARAGDARALRVIDMLLGLIFASLLTILSWPAFASDGPGVPVPGYLYLGYGAMAMLSALGWIARATPAARRLARALFWTFALYGAAATVLSEWLARGGITLDSPVFVTGNVAFVAYLALLPRDRAGDPAPPPGEPSTLAGRIVPLALTMLIVALSFRIEQVAPSAGIAAGLAALILHAGRTTLTERRHLGAQRAAQAADRARLQGLLDLMHEVRSPLGAVALNAGFLRRSTQTDPDQRAICDAIGNGCDAVARLLDDVLSLERLEAGLIPAQPARHDAAAIARGAVALLLAQARDAGVCITAPDGTLEARVDRDALHRIALNLIDNAVRFTPAGGTVTVTVAHMPGGALLLSVADDGVGMSAATRERLFQRFAVAGKPLHGRRGTGLGLSISLALARSMGGTIEAGDDRARGTLMKVLIPQ